MYYPAGKKTTLTKSWTKFVPMSKIAHEEIESMFKRIENTNWINPIFLTLKKVVITLPISLDQSNFEITSEIEVKWSAMNGCYI